MRERRGLLGGSLFFTGVTFAATMPYAGIVAIEGLGMSNTDYALILAASSTIGVGLSIAGAVVLVVAHDFIQRRMAVAAG